RRRLADVVPMLSSGESRQLAYEMAVCVCDADGRTSAREQAVLTELREALGLAQTEFAAQADALAATPLGAACAPMPDTVAPDRPAPHPAAVDALPGMP